MIILLLWIKPIVKPWIYLSSNYGLIIDGIRAVFISIHVIIHLLCYKTEITKYMARSYEYFSTLATNPTSENLAFVQKKARAYMHILGLVSF